MWTLFGVVLWGKCFQILISEQISVPLVSVCKVTRSLSGSPASLELFRAARVLPRRTELDLQAPAAELLTEVAGGGTHSVQRG